MNDFMSSRQLARCLAASVVHQIKGKPQETLTESDDRLLDRLSNEMHMPAKDIIEVTKTDPWMFFIMTNMAISSGIIIVYDGMKEQTWTA